MKTSNLIQRLKTPINNKLLNAFSFGGGLVNGGLGKEAMECLKNIFSFDYMGSAEFEWGAVPEALQCIAKGIHSEEYTHFNFECIWKYKDWKDKITIKGNRTIYVICKLEDKEEIVNRIKLFSKNSFNDTKEMIHLDMALADKMHINNLSGWLELDNGYMFFICEEMYNKTVQLFWGEK